jgi:hypothetical protein
VKVGDPFKVSVISECPKPPAGYCGKVGKFLYRDFTATLLDPVDNVCTDMTGIEIKVSIHPSFMTPGAYVQGTLRIPTVAGIAIFRASPGSIRLDKLPRNPEDGYKLKFEAISNTATDQ